MNGNDKKITEVNADFEKSIKFHDGKRMRVKVVAANYSSKVIGRV